MQTVGAAGPAFVDAVVVDDDVGVIAPLNCRLTTSCGHRQHDVTACQRTEIVNQRGKVVACLEQYESARPTQLRGDRGDLLCEFAVAQRGGFGQHSDPIRVFVQMVDEFVHRRATPLPITLMRTLASMDGGSRLCCRTMIGAMSPVGSMVSSTSCPRNSWPMTVPMPSRLSLSEITVATSCSGRSARIAGPSPVEVCTGTRPRAHSATPEVTVHGSEMQSPRNSAVKRSLGRR